MTKRHCLANQFNENMGGTSSEKWMALFGAVLLLDITDLMITLPGPMNMLLILIAFGLLFSLMGCGFVEAVFCSVSASAKGLTCRQAVTNIVASCVDGALIGAGMLANIIMLRWCVWGALFGMVTVDGGLAAFGLWIADNVIPARFRAGGPFDEEIKAACLACGLKDPDIPVYD